MLADAEQIIEQLSGAASANEALLEQHRRETIAVEVANASISDDVGKIWAQYRVERSFFSKLFDVALPPPLKAKVAELLSRKRSLPSVPYNQLITIRDVVGEAMWHRYNGHLFRGNPGTKVTSETLAFLRTRMRSIRYELERSSRLESKKAKLAAADNQTRTLAKQVKAELQRQLLDHPDCPYCGNDIGDSREADHIYPVVLGGLSTPENMVYICKRCNSQKSSLTLTMFIKKMGFDRELVEARLERIGKRF
jgi:5-methylcytosine-specific restriction endonuclease McrA